jgi:uncharacterized protein (TIGR00369 family)
MSREAAQQRLETAFDTHHRSFFLVELLGLEISYDDDVCIVRFPVDDFLFNPQGSYHGGLLAAVMDVAMAHLSKHVNGRVGATVELQSRFMRPLTKGPARCEARYTRNGRSIGFVEAEIWDADGNSIAQGTATWTLPG